MISEAEISVSVNSRGMGSLGGGGNWGPFGMGQLNFHDFNNNRRRSPRKRSIRESKSSSNSADITGRTGYQFPVKQAFMAASLALTGDTIAQLSQRWVKYKESLSSPQHPEVAHYSSFYSNEFFFFFF
mgnify:CR=1 FL=1